MTTDPHRYCSLGDSRSWTDLVTNVAQLSATRVDEDFDALMGWGSVPHELLPGFLHELTHHWCFLSPVGFTLAMLQLRARRTGVLLYNDKGDRDALRWRLVDDLQRYETVATMLRPLAEGLALFAEFDALSGPETSVQSLPSELTGSFFGLLDTRDPQTNIHFLYEAHRRPVGTMRSGYHCFRRKRALLQQPLDLSAGGYLPGYLTVRELWLHLAQQDMRLLNETDLVLMYLRSFFYDDHGLVELLLRPGSELDAHIDIVRHLAERFDRVAAVDAADVAAYEEAIVMPQDDTAYGERTAALAAAVLVTPDEYRAGSTLALEMVAEYNTPDLETVEGLMRLWDAEVLAYRDVMYLGSVDCEAEVGDDGTCTVTVGDASRELPAAEGIDPGRGEGRIDLFFSTMTDTKARAAVVYRGDEKAAISFGGPDAMTETARERFAGLRTSRASIQAGTAEMNETMESFIAGDPVVGRHVEDTREVASGAATAIYHNMSTLDVDPDRRPLVVDALARDGFLDVLGWDPDLTDGLALLSLAWPLRLRRNDVEAMLADRGMRLSDLLPCLEACSPRFGRRLVFEGPDLLLTAV